MLAVTMLDLREQKIPQAFFLNGDTDLMRQSFGENRFEVLIPLLKTLRAHSTLVGDAEYTYACASDDGNTLLTVQDGCLYLVKADTAKIEATEAASTSH